MSFNRLMYDTCDERTRLGESMGPGNYILQTPKPSNPCYPANPQIISQKAGFISNTTTESQLFNMNKPLSRCPEQPEIVSGQSQFKYEPDCDIPIENTRLSNPPCTLRGTGWNRFDPICMNPQDQIFFPGEYQIPTRLVFKDNHRPLLPRVNINDMNPIPTKKICEKIKPTCANYTGSLYQYDVCG